MTDKIRGTYDVLQCLIDCCDILDVIAGVLVFATDIETAQRLLQVRLSPCKVLSQLCDDPLEMLRTMIASHVILVGPKAAEYFCPGSDYHGAPFQFVAIAPVFQDQTNECFMPYIRSIGAKLSLEGDSTCYKGEITLRGKSERLLYRSSERVAMYVVLEQPCSACQCFISGMGAVHAQGISSSLRKMILWGGIDQSDPAKLQAAAHHDHGYISIDSPGYISHSPAKGNYQHRNRCLLDVEALVIPYPSMAGYYRDETCTQWWDSTIEHHWVENYKTI
jgi:hypothetical protein